MSDEISAVEKAIEEILLDLMAEKVMSVGSARPERRNCPEQS
jgi:hypothetical protein